MSKFKVGDKVTETAEQRFPNYSEGKVGTVVRFWDDFAPEDSPVVEVEGEEWYYIDSELELVEEPVVKTYLKAVRTNSYYEEGKNHITVGKIYEATKHSENLYSFVNDEGEVNYTNLDVGYHGFDFEVVEEPTMKIETGKYYKTAKGDKIGPAEVIRGITYPWNIPHDGGFYGYTADGVSCLAVTDDDFFSQDNIVGEWLEEEPTMKCEAEKRGYKKVVITEDVAGWPVGTVAWADFNNHKVYNDDCSDYWYHTVGDNCEWLEEETEEPKVEEKVFGEVYLGVGNFPYTYSTFCDGETKGTATVTYTDGKPTKMAWTSTE